MPLLLAMIFAALLAVQCNSDAAQASVQSPETDTIKPDYVEQDENIRRIALEVALTRLIPARYFFSYQEPRRMPG